MAMLKSRKKVQQENLMRRSLKEIKHFKQGPLLPFVHGFYLMIHQYELYGHGMIFAIYIA